MPIKFALAEIILNIGQNLNTMAVIPLSQSELANIQKIGILLNQLSKVIGPGEFNEIRFYDEQQAEKAATVIAQRKSVSDKSNIEKFL